MKVKKHFEKYFNFPQDNEKGINSLINAYRRYGHLQAAIDPLNLGCRGR